ADGKAPKARPITAWGFNPRSDKEKEERAEGPIHTQNCKKTFENNYSRKTFEIRCWNNNNSYITIYVTVPLLARDFGSLPGFRAKKALASRCTP
ncbi:MAG: hypothetical protein ACLFUS_16965, partial [Candidatus Sumerlaeia bacterium]